MELTLFTPSEERILKTYIKHDCDITTKEMADELCNSPRTIERHKDNMKEKTQSNSFFGVVLKYLKIHKELLAVFVITLQLFSIGYKKTIRRSKVKNQIARVKTLSKTRIKNLKYYPVT